MFSVRVPATIANMGPGFDSFGMAVSLYNQFSFAPAEADSLLFSTTGAADTQELSQEAPADNIIFGAMNRLFERAGKARPPFQISVEADIPVARGLGSSSTAIVAGLVAANQFLNSPFQTAELLKIAVEMEGHPDNVAPALLGGVVLYDTVPYALPWPVEWRVLVLSPAYPVLTSEARRILPRTVSLEDSIFNLRKASTLTYALLREDPDALRASLQDRLHQPHRRQLIKEYDALEQWALAEGAFGVIISGSGSSIAVFYPTVIHAFLLENLNAFVQSQGWQLTINDVSVDTEGARLAADKTPPLLS